MIEILFGVLLFDGSFCFQLSLFNLINLFNYLFFYLMKVIIYLLALLLLALGFVSWNSTHSTVSPTSENLKFVDQRGPGCTQEEQYFFKTFVNDASTFYRGDYENSLAFPSDELANRYGGKFSVMVQNYSYSITNSYLWSPAGEYAGLGAGSDTIFASNSYLMVGNSPKSANISRNFVENVGDAGSGLDESQKKIIDNIITSLE